MDPNLLARVVTGLEEVKSFTKPPLLQESRLNGGGSPIGCVVEWKVPVE